MPKSFEISSQIVSKRSTENCTSRERFSASKALKMLFLVSNPSEHIIKGYG